VCFQRHTPRYRAFTHLSCPLVSSLQAIGSGSEGAQTNLQESYSDSFTLEEAEDLALSTLKQVMEEKISAEYVEVCSVTKEGFKSYGKEALTAVLARI